MTDLFSPTRILDALGVAFANSFGEGGVPAEFWRIGWPLSLMAISGYPLVIAWPVVRADVEARLDRWFLAPLFGMAYYTIVFTLANAVFGVPIAEGSFYLVFLLTTAVGYGWIASKRIAWKGRWQPSDGLVAAALIALFFLSAAIRFDMTLKYPDRLLDSDPYRHYPRTEWIAQTGDLARSEPWLTGDVPIYEVQGCYVLAALLARVGHVDAFTVWKFGSPVMGAWSALSLYVLAAYFAPGGRRRFAGLVAAALVAATSVHITRTNMGFSAPWALVYLPLALLAIRWAFWHGSVSAGALFGLLLLAVGASNMVPVSMLVVFLLPYCAYELVRRLRRPSRVALRPFLGLALGAALFFAFIGVWQVTYAGVPLPVGARAHAVETSGIMKAAFRKEEEAARERAQRAGDLSPVDRSFVALAGWHNASILRRYLGRATLLAGCLGVLLVLAAPAPWWSRRRAERRVENGRWLDARVFLLLFTVLPLAQFALLPTLMRSDLLRDEDVLDAQRLVARLARDDERVVRHLRARLPPTALARLDAHGGAGDPPADLRDLLVRELNRLILDEDLYGADPGAFSEVSFQPATQRLAYRALSEEERVYFGRLVLEAVFPDELARRDFLGFRFRNFTGRTYRYLVLPAYCLSLALGLAAALLVDLAVAALARLRERPVSRLEVVRVALMAGVLIPLCVHLASARGFGNWPPTSTPATERAFEWMIRSLPPDARVICDWFEADFVRTYSVRAGRPVWAIFGGSAGRSGIRGNIRPAMAEAGLAIPDLRSPDEILAYTGRIPGNYYVLKTRWGPWIDLDGRAGFVRVASFPGERGGASVFALTSNPVEVEPLLPSEAIPIAASELGEIRRLDKISDGTAGRNERGDCAYEEPLQRRSHWAWFGLEFPETTQVLAAQVYFGWRRDPGAIGRSRLMYVPTEYAFESWDGQRWNEVPGTRVEHNRSAHVRHTFDAPVSTSKLRVFVYGMRDIDGSTRGTSDYRATCLEFDVLTADSGRAELGDL